jgi:hypothetical protein
MVATFGEGADYMSFKQVGGVMRFPVRNLPREAQFVVTMNDKTITGQFPVDITALGETCMAAGTAASELVINYTSDVDGAYAEFNVPVPTGVYNNFTVTIKDTEGNELFAKNYSAENKVERATLLNMKELVLPERPMAISEVWPFFVDARVVFAKYEGVEKYAFYIDGSEEPVIKDAEDLDDKAGALIGGTFGHNTTHTVAVAKVVDGEPVVTSKSAAVTFTTGDIHQLTTNTGTKFVSVGWDDVAIGWGPEYDPITKRWSVVSKAVNPDNVSVHYKRGYNVQLLASDKETVIYDIIPFDGHAAFTGLFSDSSWLGKVNNENIMIPTALSFGWLDPGKDYYFRVKTLDGVVNIGPVDNKEENVIQGNYNPEDGGKYPVPYPIHSDRGGCAWSDLVKVSTDPITPLTETLIFHEGFDDLMVASDYVNWASAVVPDMEQTRADWDTYTANMKNTYPTFLELSADERKWTTIAFSEQVRADNLGLYDAPYAKDQENKLNAFAGSLEGWTVRSNNTGSRNMYPIFGAVRLGQSGSNTNGSTLTTPAIRSSKLLKDIGTKATVTVKVGICATSIPVNELATLLNITHLREGETVKTVSYSINEEHADDWNANHGNSISATDYVHYQQYYDIVFETYLRNNDKLSFAKEVNNRTKGFIILGDIKIEIDPNVLEGGVNPEDTGMGTDPDENVNYDVFGLGEFPITYYFGPPTSWYGSDQQKTIETYTDIKNAGFNIATYIGEKDYSIAEQKRILNVCENLGLKFISSVGGGGLTSEAMIPEVKEHLYPSPAYLGDFMRDEPKESEFDAMGSYVRKFLNEMPDKEVYNNLFPMIAGNSQTGSTSYEAHIDAYLAKVPTKSVSFDFYPLINKHELQYNFYKNLDLVREKTLNLRKPFWAITQAGPIGTGTIDPTEVEQRWSVWANIAMGSKGISYFTYWTPPAEVNLGPVGFMVLRDGTKRDIYYWIKKINSDIKTIGKKLLYCHADGCLMSSISYPLWSNGGVGRTKYGPIKKVSTLNNSVICGCFRDARPSMNGDNYKGYKALVLSKVHNWDVDAVLEIDNVVTEITITHNNISETVQLVGGLSTKVGDISVSYLDSKLTFGIPSGEAVLVEF